VTRDFPSETVEASKGPGGPNQDADGNTATMDLGDLISSEAVIPALKAKSKKQVLQELAERAASLSGVDKHEIFDRLLHRERLGSTGVGRGVAIPHGKLIGLDRIVCVFARLEEPIDFEAIDDQPVDLVFALLAPEQAGADHLKALARISRLLREPGTLERLRGSRDRHALHAVLTSSVTTHAA
jgi:PTS system nitrogen regulatory IIA component